MNPKITIKIDQYEFELIGQSEEKSFPTPANLPVMTVDLSVIRPDKLPTIDIIKKLRPGNKLDKNKIEIITPNFIKVYKKITIRDLKFKTLIGSSLNYKDNLFRLSIFFREKECIELDLNTFDLSE